MLNTRAGAVAALVVVLAGLLSGVGPAAGAPVAAASPVLPALAPGGSFVPVAPVRVLDNRRSPVGRQAPFSVRSALPVPPSQVDAVVLNVTVVDAVGPGYFAVNGYNGSSAGNFTTRVPTASIAVGDISAEGGAEIDTSADAHVVVDLQGYVSTQEAAARTFTPVSPVRAADSRSSAGLRTFGPAATQYLDVRGRARLPADATAVVANLTVARASAPTYVTGWSGTGSRPVVSSVNALAGQIVANRVLLPLGSDGRVALFNAAGSTDLVVDVVGYVSPSASGSYFTLSPGQRLFDGRTTSATVAATLDPARPGGRAVAPAVTDLVPTTAVWLAVAGDAPAGRGYVAVRPGGVAPTGTSDLNLVPGRTVSNAGPVAVSATGTIALLSSPTSRVVVDTFGWFVRPVRARRPPGSGPRSGPRTGSSDRSCRARSSRRRPPTACSPARRATGPRASPTPGPAAPSSNASSRTGTATMSGTGAPRAGSGVSPASCRWRATGSRTIPPCTRGPATAGCGRSAPTATASWPPRP